MKKFTCLIDMDGVLVDYYRGVMKVLSEQANYAGLVTCDVPLAYPYPFTPGVWKFFGEAPLKIPSELIASFMTREFYASLDWMPDGKFILKTLEDAFGVENVYIATSPWDTEGCLDGKAAWIAREMPQYKRRVMYGTPKHLLANPDTVLYDDSADNCEKFTKAGGYACLIPRMWNSYHKMADKDTGSIVYHEKDTAGHMLHCWYSCGLKAKRENAELIEQMRAGHRPPVDILSMLFGMSGRR